MDKINKFNELTLTEEDIDEETNEEYSILLISNSHYKLLLKYLMQYSKLQEQKRQSYKNKREKEGKNIKERSHSEFPKVLRCNKNTSPSEALMIFQITNKIDKNVSPVCLFNKLSSNMELKIKEKLENELKRRIGDKYKIKCEQENSSNSSSN